MASGARSGGLLRRRLGAYLALARISNTPTVLTNVLAGAALAGVAVPDARVAAVGAAMALFYTAGMFLNDLCDYAYDLRERPERPLPSGTVPRPEAVVATGGLFLAGAILLLTLGRAPFLSGVVLVAAILLYDFWHKANPFSPFVMAAARALVYVTAFLTFSTRGTAPLLAAAALLAVYVVGLTFVARGEGGSTGARLRLAAPLVLPAAYPFAFGILSPATLLLALFFVGWVVYSVSFASRAKDRDVGRSVGHLIAGISLYDALVLAAAGASLGWTLALAAFAGTLLLQRYVRGT